jgi:hypothetical protein
MSTPYIQHGEGVNRDLEEMNVMYGRYSTVVAVAVVVVEARTLR